MENLRRFDERPGQTYEKFWMLHCQKRQEPLGIYSMRRHAECTEDVQHHRGKQLYTMHWFIKGFYKEALIAKASFSSASVCRIHN